MVHSQREEGLTICRCVYETMCGLQLHLRSPKSINQFMNHPDISAILETILNLFLDWVNYY